jgi:hypothetical protein
MQVPKLQKVTHRKARKNCKFVFTDVAIEPDGTPEEPKTTGIGILIRDNHQNIKYAICAQVQNCYSVLMAEAAGLSLASSIITKLQLR